MIRAASGIALWGGDGFDKLGRLILSNLGWHTNTYMHTQKEEKK